MAKHETRKTTKDGRRLTLDRKKARRRIAKNGGAR